MDPQVEKIDEVLFPKLSVCYQFIPISFSIWLILIRKFFLMTKMQQQGHFLGIIIRICIITNEFDNNKFRKGKLLQYNPLDEEDFQLTLNPNLKKEKEKLDKGTDLFDLYALDFFFATFLSLNVLWLTWCMINSFLDGYAKRYVFLFTDSLLITKKVNKKRFDVKLVLNLFDKDVRPDPSSNCILFLFPNFS